MDASLDSTLSLVNEERILEIAYGFIKIMSILGDEKAVALHAKNLARGSNRT